jgi:hypothetical protein
MLGNDLGSRRFPQGRRCRMSQCTACCRVALAATHDIATCVSMLMKMTCGAATLEGQLSVDSLLQEVRTMSREGHSHASIHLLVIYSASLVRIPVKILVHGNTGSPSAMVHRQGH